jgi:transposase
LLKPTRKHKPRIKKLRALARNPAVDLWAIDEVHFQQHGSRARMWIPPEVEDPVVRHHPTRKSVGYFGAVRLRDGKFLFQRETNCFDAMSTWSFLRRLRWSSRRSGHRVVLITDNAKYHHAKVHAPWRVEQQPDFTLSYLPPYSPDLNPIERVWKLTRRLCLHNRYFPTLDGVVEAVEERFATWMLPNESLKRLCAVA